MYPLRINIIGLVLMLIFGACSDNIQNSSVGHDSLQSHDESKGAVIEFDTDFVDLGNITHGEIVSYFFTVTNVGNEALVVKDLIPDCGCTDITISKKVLQPNEKAKLNLIFNSRGWYGTQYKSVRVVSNATTPNRSVTIKANVIN